MLQSAGHRVLDEESIRTIQTWNFAYMGKCDLVRIPIIYSLRPRQEVKIVPDADELLLWATRIGGRYMGSERAQEFGRRNAVPPELIVRVTPVRIVAKIDIAD